MEHLRSHILEFGDAVKRKDLQKIITSCIKIDITCAALLEEYKTDDDVTSYLKTIRYMAARTNAVAGGGRGALLADGSFDFQLAGKTFNRFAEHLKTIAAKLKIKMGAITRRFEEIES